MIPIESYAGGLMYPYPTSEDVFSVLKTYAGTTHATPTVSDSGFLQRCICVYTTPKAEIHTWQSHKYDQRAEVFPVVDGSTRHGSSAAIELYRLVENQMSGGR